MLAEILSRDSFTMKRPLFTDGEPDGYASAAPVVGTWGNPTSRDLELAGRLGVQVTAVVATFADLRQGDRLEGLRDANWTVTHTRQLQTQHRRCFLLEVA